MTGVTGRPPHGRENPGAGSKDPNRLQSAADLLRSVQCIGDDILLQHLFIYVYLPQARTCIRTVPWSYDVQTLPTFAGWRCGWLEIGDVAPVNGLGGVVLNCKLHWSDGSNQQCYVTGDGELVMHLYPEPHSRFAQSEPHINSRSTSNPQWSVVTVSHDLTEGEIESGLRGIVHGSISPALNGRKVSHVVGINRDDFVACAKFRPVGSAASFVHLLPGRLRKFAPELIREYQWRVKERWTLDNARAVLGFLSKLFNRAKDNDVAVRELHRQLRDRMKGAEAVRKADEQLHEKNMTKLDQLVHSLDKTL